MAEAIRNEDIPDIIVLNKKKKETPQEKEKVFRLSQKMNIVKIFNEKLLNRVKNMKNVANAEDAI
jgi:hypothetical protein